MSGAKEKKKIGLTTQIFIALIVGAILGIVLHVAASDVEFVQNVLINGVFYVIGQGFIRLMQMLVVPLVFCSLICGATAIGDSKTLGKVGIKIIGFYIITTMMAVAVAAPLAAQQPARPFTIQETGKAFYRLDDAVKSIGGGDGTILIAPGRYKDCAIVEAGRVAFRAAQPGTAILDGVTCEGKAALVYSRLAKRLRVLGLRSFREYCALVEGADGVDERQAMTAALTTNVTRFYREPHHFDDLRDRVMPALARRAKAGGRVRLWSAACSNGQEPYSMALTVLLQGRSIGDTLRMTLLGFVPNDPSLSGLLAGGGVWNAVGVPPVKDIEITVPGLPPRFNGYRLVQLTDLHISRLFPAAWTRRVVDRANGAGADLIVVTGDFIDGSVAMRRDDVEPLRDLRAPDGVYAIPGNHEYFFDYHEWMGHLGSLGMHMLPNAHAVLERGDGRLVLAGVTDVSAPTVGQPGPDLNAALAGAPRDVPVLLLDHQPREARRAAARGVALQLSGHTHGGMIRVLDRLVAPANGGFVSGRYEIDGMTLYVSNGTALWPGFALRLGRPSELTRITLRRDDAAPF